FPSSQPCLPRGVDTPPCRRPCTSPPLSSLCDREAGGVGPPAEVDKSTKRRWKWPLFRQNPCLSRGFAQEGGAGGQEDRDGAEEDEPAPQARRSGDRTDHGRSGE